MGNLGLHKLNWIYKTIVVPELLLQILLKIIYERDKIYLEDQNLKNVSFFLCQVQKEFSSFTLTFLYKSDFYYIHSTIIL